MNKSELIDAVADRSGVSEADAGTTIDGFFVVLTSAVKRGDQIVWPGFGSSARRSRPPAQAQPTDRRSSGHLCLDPDEVHLEQCSNVS